MLQEIQLQGIWGAGRAGHNVVEMAVAVPFEEPAIRYLREILPEAIDAAAEEVAVRHPDVAAGVTVNGRPGNDPDGNDAMWNSRKNLNCIQERIGTIEIHVNCSIALGLYVCKNLGCGNVIPACVIHDVKVFNGLAIDRKSYVAAVLPKSSGFSQPKTKLMPPPSHRTPT